MFVAIVYKIDGSVKRKPIILGFELQSSRVVERPSKNGQRMKQSASGEASTKEMSALITR